MAGLGGVPGLGGLVAAEVEFVTPAVLVGICYEVVVAAAVLDDGKVRDLQSKGNARFVDLVRILVNFRSLLFGELVAVDVIAVVELVEFPALVVIFGITGLAFSQAVVPHCEK